MHKKNKVMTEEELELAADKLLEQADEVNAKKSEKRRHKPAEEPQPDEAKTPDELLAELLEKAKKNGKISTEVKEKGLW